MTISARNRRSCASCSRFPLELSEATAGTAECAMFNKPAAFNDTACVLHTLATDYSQRRMIVARLTHVTE